MDDSQGQLRFDDVGSGSGLDRWREQFNAAQRELAGKLGLPIDRQVEVWLKDGLRLRGVLRLCEQRLFVIDGEKYDMALEVDRVSFRHAEIESCVVMADAD